MTSKPKDTAKNKVPVPSIQKDQAARQSRIRDLTVLSIATISVLSVVGIGYLVTTQAQQGSDQKKVMDERKVQADAILKAPKSVPCPTPTIYDINHVEETPTITVRIVSAAVAKKLNTTPATAEHAASTSETSYYRVVYAVKNKTGTPVHLNQSSKPAYETYLEGYDKPVVRIDGSMTGYGRDGISALPDYVNGDTGIPDVLEPYQEATQVAAITLGNEIIMGVGPDSFSTPNGASACMLKGWQVK